MGIASTGTIGSISPSKKILSPRKLHPVLRAERAKKHWFATGQKNYFFGCLMNAILGVVK